MSTRTRTQRSRNSSIPLLHCVGATVNDINRFVLRRTKSKLKRPTVTRTAIAVIVLGNTHVKSNVVLPVSGVQRNNGEKTWPAVESAKNISVRFVCHAPRTLSFTVTFVLSKRARLQSQKPRSRRPRNTAIVSPGTRVTGE